MEISATTAAIAGAAYAVIKPSVETASGIVSKLCNPVAEQIGLYLGDKAKEYRTNNFIQTIKRMLQCVIH